MTTSREALRPLVLASFVLLATGIFIAPYFLPPASVVKSASTILGFNNALAYLLYLLGLSSTAWLLSRFRSWQGPAVMSLPARLSWPGAIVWWVGFAHAVGFLLLYSYKRQFVFAEGLYFQHVAFRVASGEAAYTTVNFLYGPATLYPVVFLSRFMSASAAYGTYYVAVYLAGLYALYTMLRWCVSDRTKCDRAFLILAVAFFNPLTGLNYTFLRHLLPALTILTTWEYLATEGGWKRLLIGAGALWMSMMYSPDVGVASAIGVAILTALHSAREAQSAASRPSERLKAFWIPGLAVAMTLLVFAMIPQGLEALGSYVGILWKFSAGGSNTPVEISVPLGALLALMVLVATAVLVLLRRQGLQGTSVPLVALLLTFAIMQRAAFGKPDVLHIAYAALPVLIVCLVVVPGVWGARKTRTWLLLSVLALGLPLQYYHASLFLPFLASRVAAQHRTTDATHASGPPIMAQLDELVRSMGSAQPYYMHNLTYYSLPVFKKHHLRYALRFTTPEEAFTDRDVRASIDQLAASGASVVVLRNDLEAGPGGDLSQSSTFLSIIDSLAASPVPGSRVYRAVLTAQRGLWQPFVDHLQACYEVHAQTRDLIGFAPPAAGLPAHCQDAANRHAL